MTNILVVTELSTLNSGLAIYGRNLIRLLIERGHKVTEFAIGFTNEIPNVEWDLILNQAQQHEQEEYNYNPNNVNGQWKFERVLLEVKPDLVIDVRDVFNYAYQTVSPYRRLFNHIGIAAVDGVPQKKQWIEIFAGLDGVFTYTQWGKEILEKEGIRVDGIAAPSASNLFIRKDNTELKTIVGIKDYKVVGSIMRNQPRKLIPELFEGFRYYLDYIKKENTLLYLHSAYPDVGYNIPELLLMYGLSSKVLFTFCCKDCDAVFPSFWRGSRSFCPHCGKGSVRTVELSDGVNEDTLSDIISMFDAYIQVASREGFGMSQLEAMKCGKPVATINYSGMTNFIDNYNALPIEPDVLKFSYDMDMYDASVKPETVAQAINDVLQKTIDETITESWEESLFDILEYVDKNNFKGRWGSSYDIKPFPEYRTIKCSNYDYAKYLILNVLQKPEYMSSLMFTRLVEDLNYGFTFGRHYGTYLLEPQLCKGKTLPFDREIAYTYLAEERERINLWENERMNLERNGE
jgi:glycosyltransferase involved in cell wall biosynthesis